MLLNFDATRSVLLVQRLNCLFDAPFVLQNVEADRSVLIDVRVKDRRSEDDGRRAVPAQQTVPRRACSLCGLQKKSEREAQILGFRNIPTIILRN